MVASRLGGPRRRRCIALVDRFRSVWVGTLLTNDRILRFGCRVTGFTACPERAAHADSTPTRL